ncbi:MAG: SDR family NAD(P)-dependent oxidoreductase [Bacteroidales bacterium]|nr:SDR family NAD(P)-dependent oxidoreductase [Bacteroidales bacterium]MCF8344421.1 SDR family NAD(P)-dependent oxidoreductase [Bacteroidales bacterium]MCF8351206.1 SDR family NAD(P)-dependent oxidoreductase [Bacteroidales bacterium]MCF8377659.1 SDR family NAD(P)-dependent oxidoreductase [Bacteroidales bacterium]MCF8402059.1 SDR family NAD(P)-dependent oxidoreductase [Bacteroidales bacterium]
MSKKLIAIVGMGPLISLSVAERFAREGYRVAMIARHDEKLKELKEHLSRQGFEADYFTGDASSETSLRKAFAQIQSKMGDPDVLHYNAAKIKRSNLLEETASSLTEDFRVNVAGALSAVKAVLPAMRQKNEGSILITGGGLSVDPHPEYGSLSIGKAGIRNFTHTLARSLKNTDIYVSTIIIRGFVSHDKEKYNPKDIADLFWKMHREKNPVELEY